MHKLKAVSLALFCLFASPYAAFAEHGSLVEETDGDGGGCYKGAAGCGGPPVVSCSSPYTNVGGSCMQWIEYCPSGYQDNGSNCIRKELLGVSVTSTGAPNGGNGSAGGVSSGGQDFVSAGRSVNGQYTTASSSVVDNYKTLYANKIGYYQAAPSSSDGSGCQSPTGSC